MNSSAALRPLRVLIVGSMPPPIGGTTIGLQQLVNHLEGENELDVRVVNTANIRGNILRRPFRSIKFALSLVYAVFLVDVVTFHGATTSMPVLGSMMTVLTTISRKPLIIRKFAGLDYMELGSLRGRIAHYVASHADQYLTETKRLTTLSKERGIKNVSWYPTSRPSTNSERAKSVGGEKCRRFVYIGHVRESKGIRELVEAAERCGAEISVDIYGPLFDDVDPGLFNELSRVTRHDPIPYDEVVPTLQLYDMSLLPSKAVTEGYPGIVFEGYSVGLPIIASNIGAIPEIVDESSGILIAPGNADDLYSAMKRVTQDDDLYAELKRGASQKFEGYSTAFWADRFSQICKTVA